MTNPYKRSRDGRRKRPGPKPAPRTFLSKVPTDSDTELKVDLHITDPQKAKPGYRGVLVVHIGIWRRREYDVVTRGGRAVRMPVEDGEIDVAAPNGITLAFEKQYPAVAPELIKGLVEALRLSAPEKLGAVKAMVEEAISKEEGEKR